VRHPERRPGAGLPPSSPAYQAYQVLHLGFTVAPILAGADKCGDFMVDWTTYVWPVLPSTLGVSAQAFMYAVGMVEPLDSPYVAYGMRVSETSRREYPGREMAPSALPTGTVTFLFTDVEGSTRLWEEQPEAMRTAIARHDAVLRRAVLAHGGHVVKTTGDGLHAAFATAGGALAACLDAQAVLQAGDWGAVGPLRVRMALHTGAAELRDGDYYGPALNRAARLLAAAHGGQVLLSQVTAALVRDDLPGGADLRDLGEQRLRDVPRPERISQLLAPVLPAEFPPLRTAGATHHNLPLPLTSFVGREHELAAVTEVLRTHRLVTLTGPAGTGKTRLALQVAAAVLDEFADGVFVAALAPLSDPALVLSTIAQTLGVREAAGRPLLESLKDYLREKQLLLLLDNFEQVLAAAPLVSDLLASCRDLTVLVTSREVLHLAGEYDFPVPPLRLPEVTHLLTPERLSQYEAVRLFIARALAVKPDFAVTNENAPAVADICHRLDGLPLAIELAAARSRLFPPQALRTRLEHRLPLLTGGGRDLPARQQTLRNAIAWSYDLLDAAEQALFRRLAVFVGGCTVKAAEAVCLAGGDPALDIVDGLDALVSKSLLRPDEESAGEEPRVGMLETIREYALEQLELSGEAERVRGLQAAYYLAVAEQAELELHGPEQVAWVARLEREHDNFRAALAWALDRGERGAPTPRAERGQGGPGGAGEAGEVALRLAGALWWFWQMHGDLTEGRRWLEGLVHQRRAAPTARWANGLAKAGYMAWAQGDHGVARAHVEESLAVLRELGDRRGIALALFVLGGVVWAQGDYARARSLGEENLALCRELGDTWHTALALNGLGTMARDQGDYMLARARCEESLALFRELRDTQGVAWSLYGLGEVARDQGDDALARSLLEESLALFRELGDTWGIAWSLHDLGEVAAVRGDHAIARARCEQSLTLFRELGDKPGIASSLHNLGLVARDQGDYTLARSLQEESLALRRQAGDKPGIANSLYGLGSVAGRQGDHSAARALLEQSLALQREVGDQRGIAACLEGVARVSSAEGSPERAARLLGAAAARRDAVGASLPPAERAAYERIVATVRAYLEPAVFAAAWAEGQAMSLEQAVAYAVADAPDAAAPGPTAA
jgi:predicted ATPase/class 3 adenylate cyclase